MSWLFQTIFRFWALFEKVREVVGTWKIFRRRSLGFGGDRVAGAAVAHATGDEQDEFILRSARKIPQNERP